jgi:hypothetical protein
MRFYEVCLIVGLACAVPLTAESAQPCAQLGQICATPDNQSNPPCCEGLVCGENARCLAGPTTTTVVTTTTTTVVGQTTTTVVGTTTTTVPVTGGLAPISVTAQDVSVKLRGGFDYSTFRGHAANQYERDMMEQTLLGKWVPLALAYMKTTPKCVSYVHSAISSSTLNAITPRLDVVHQYDDILGPQGKKWIVTVGGRHYQVEGYILKHAHDCSLNDPAACAKNPLMTTDLADLLDLTVDNGVCMDGAGFAPAVTEPMSDDPNDGTPDGNQMFGPLSPADDALLQKAIDAHMGGSCGATPNGSVQAAQTAFEATCTTIDCIHFRTAQPFIGGCDPAMPADQCCAWKALEHREYLAWADAVRKGDWGLARCAGGRHRRIHLCSHLVLDGLIIRMPPCTRPASYPDDTNAVTCTAYLADPTP